MKSPRIAMIVDHPLRDLPGLVLVGRALAQAGAQVFLVPMYSQDREVFTLKPDFVLLNYLRKNNEHFVEKLKVAGIPYGILDTEGGFYGDMRGYSTVLSQRHDLYSSVLCNLIWGQRMMDFWSKEYPAKHPLFLTGLPRFDFYAKNFRDLKFDFIPKKYHEKPMILINTKIALVNPLFISFEKELDLYRNKLGIPEDKIQFYIKYGRLAIEDTIRMSQELSSDFPQAQVVVRPHPHENHRTYEGPLAHVPHVSVFRDGNVTPWILQSSILIHRHCTTAIESALAGKTPIAPQWMNTSAEAPAAEAVSLKPQSRAEMNEMIQAGLSEKGLPTVAGIDEEIQKIVDMWLFKMDGQSHQRAADAVLETLPRNIQISDSKVRDFAFATFSTRTDAIGKAYHALNQASGATSPSLLWMLEGMRLSKWKKTQKHYTPEECAAWSSPLDQKENRAFHFSWAKDYDQYHWGYPGRSVMITKA